MGVNIYIYLFDPQPYEELILPAYRSFVDQGDIAPLIVLLKHAITRLRALPAGYGASFLSERMCEESLAILARIKYYSSKGREPNEGDITTGEDMRIFVDGSIGPDLLQIFCIPRNLGINPEQNMSHRTLVEYLYSRSQWIEDYFTGSKQVTGTIPEIKVGEFCQFFSRTELEAFDQELIKLERPADKQALADGFDNLRALVHTAATNPGLRLLYVYI